MASKVKCLYILQKPTVIIFWIISEKIYFLAQNLFNTFFGILFEFFWISFSWIRIPRLPCTVERICRMYKIFNKISISLEMTSLKYTICWLVHIYSHIYNQFQSTLLDNSFSSKEIFYCKIPCKYTGLFSVSVYLWEDETNHLFYFKIIHKRFFYDHFFILFSFFDLLILLSVCGSILTKYTTMFVLP